MENSVIISRRPIGIIAIYKRATFPGETYNPIIPFHKLVPYNPNGASYFDTSGDICSCYMNPMYILQDSRMPAPLGYSLFLHPGMNEKTRERIREDQRLNNTPLPPAIPANPSIQPNLATENGLATTVGFGMYPAMGSTPTGMVPQVVVPLGQPEDQEIVSVQELPNTLIKQKTYDLAQSFILYRCVRILAEQYYVFNGKNYQIQTQDEIRRLVYEHSRTAIKEEDSAYLADNILKHIKAEPKIAEKFETPDETRLCFKNGVLNMDTGILSKHSPDYNLFYCLNAEYYPNSYHPVFDQFLIDTFGFDTELHQRVYEMIGYSIAPDTLGKCFFVFQGAPNSGKSMLANFIRDCFPEEDSAAPSFESLTRQFGLSAIIGKQLCLAMDLHSSPLDSKATSVFKQLTGNDLVSTDVKYSSHRTFKNRATFIFGTNHPIYSTNPDPAFFQRAVAIPFLNSVPPERQDKHLLEKLNAERNAILYDALQAYWRLRKNDYVFSGSYQLNQMFDHTGTIASVSIDDLLEEFIREDCCLVSEEYSFVQDLYTRFNARNPGTVNELKFSSELIDHFHNMGIFSVERASKGRRPGTKNPISRLKGITLKLQEVTTHEK